MSPDPTFTSGPSRSRRLLRGCAIFSCGCSAVIALLISVVAAWLWNLNRNPNPFPLEPETVFAVPGIPVAFEFLDADATILVLCLDDARAPTSAVLAKCDVASGTVIESRQLSFAASRMALSASGELVALAGIVPSPDSRNMNLLREKGAAVRPHTLRMVLLKRSDLSTLAETDEPCPAEWFEFFVAKSLRLVAVQGTKAWALGCTAPGGQSYTVSLRHEATLAEIKSESFAMRPEAWSTAVVGVSPNDPSLLLVGRNIDMSNSYQWDTWDTDSGVHGSHVVRLYDGLAKGFYSPPLAMPEKGRLPEVVWASWPVGHHPCAALSAHAQLFARAENAQIIADFFNAYSRYNQFRCRIEIRYFRSWQEIATGEIRGEGNQVTALRFPPVGERLVTGHLDRTVRIWNLGRLRR